MRAELGLGLVHIQCQRHEIAQASLVHNIPIRSNRYIIQFSLDLALASNDIHIVQPPYPSILFKDTLPPSNNSV